MKKLRIVILGSTGTLGSQALSVVARYRNFFEIYGLTGGKNFKKLSAQAKESGASHALLEEKDGIKAVCDLVEDPQTDVVIHTIGGVAGLLPAWSAVHTGKILLLANKESLVCAGPLLMREAARSGARIIPLDSELSAIHNCLRGVDPELVGELILTCSGGPFWTNQSALQNATKTAVLNHPTWKMGQRISVDSATLMNKGFELIEAKVLFNLPLECIRVLMHPQSVVHGMVTLTTGETRALLAPPDMSVPILSALTEIVGQSLSQKFMPLEAYPVLQFQEPRDDLFPALQLARTMARKGGTLPAVLCAADEQAVNAFLSDELPFSGIVPFVEEACTAHGANGFIAEPTFENILHILYEYRSHSGGRQKYASAQRQNHNRDRRPATTRTHV